jgi:hypothetical protein
MGLLAPQPYPATAQYNIMRLALLILSLTINGMQALRAYTRSYRSKPNDPSPDCTLAMDSNPCYEASNVKQTEAMHVYEMVKQHN